MYGDIGGWYRKVEKIKKFGWYISVKVNTHSQITRIMKKYRENIYIH
jgi:hypothetical protein